MGFFKSTKGSIISDYFVVEKEITSHFKAGATCDLALYDDHLVLTNTAKSTLSLNYSQITDVQYTCEVEELKISKSPIGRAVVGGLLFGRTGAVVGAISGSSEKVKKERNFYLIISYNNAAGEENFLVFQDKRLYKGAKISKKLRDLCNLGGSASVTHDSL